MKNLKKWMLLVGVTGAVSFNVLCSSSLQQTMRDAALAGSARWLEAATFVLIEDQLNLIPDEE